MVSRLAGDSDSVTASFFPNVVASSKADDRTVLTECYFYFQKNILLGDRLCGLVVRVLGYRFGGPGSIPGTTRFSEKNKNKTVVGPERGPLSLVSTTEELLDRKVAAPV
jgi:hypothetical protein